MALIKISPIAILGKIAKYKVNLLYGNLFKITVYRESFESNLYVSGNPARNHHDHIKQDILISKLPAIYKKISNYE